MAIYTRNGDGGFTRLADGTDLAKSEARINTIGDIDELNAHLGALICHLPADLANLLTDIQSALFTLGAQVACDDSKVLGNMKLISMQDIIHLEQLIDEMESHLQPMRFFILPGGHPCIAQAHIARAVCRRAERSLIHWVNQDDKQNFKTSVAFLNRLSDYLFMMCRYLHHRLNVEEIPWKSGK